MHRRARAAAAFAFLAGTANLAPAPSAAQETHKRVLVLHSFGRSFAPYDEFASGFQRELAQLSSEPVEFFEVSLETARFTEAMDRAPFVSYLEALAAERPVDLLVSVGAPAARFSIQERERLFPSVPLLVAGVERRMAPSLAPTHDAVVAPLDLDLPGAIENILRVAPDTTEIAVVLGGSPLSKLWLEATHRDFERFANRVRFTWLNELSLEEMEEKVAALAPHTAIFFGELSVDAAGVPHERHTALSSLHAAANAPIFGLFDTQLNRGIVGGPLVPIAKMGRETATIARRLLNGERPESIEVATASAGIPAYDFRELKRWGIPESRLPPGSTVLYRPPSLWKEYRGPLAIGLGVLALETALIGGLLVQRSHRRLAEDEARRLARRLLTAQEDERRRLARELHDDLSQRLALLSIDAAQVERSLPASAEKDSTRKMRQDLARLGDDVHDLSYRLHPSVLDDLGLNEALKVECEQFSRRESMPARLTSFQAPSPLPSEVAVCLFRIAQEAMRNAARHSGASRVNLAVTTTNGHVQLAVSDDGVGFDPARGRIRRGLGQASMRERAALLGGMVEVESSPGRGTTVKASVPLPP
jgi:signal transduction histidine kinase